MRIGFAGVPSTGKTTLSKAIAALYPDHHYIEEGLPEVFDYCRRYFLTLNSNDIRSLDGPSLGKFEEGMCAYLREQESCYEDFITDSCSLLHLMYAYTSATNIHPDVFELIKSTYWKMYRNYDIVFYLPAGVLPIVDDNRRTVNRAQNEMQDMLLSTLIAKGIGRLTTLCYSVAHIRLEDRIEFCKQQIDRESKWQRRTQRSVTPNQLSV